MNDLGLKTLYHKGSSGKAHSWRGWVEGPRYFVETGQVDGKKIISDRECFAKNVGRANETTPEQQAIIELKAEHKFKLDRKYFDTIEAIHTQKIMVMLAPNDKWEDTKRYAIYPGFMQPKLNGGRGLAYWVEIDGVWKVVIMTRGQKFWDLPHISAQLEKIMPRDCMFDGELYIHGTSLQTIMSWVRKHHPQTLTVGFHVYDVLADGEMKPQRERIADLNRLVPTKEDGSPSDETPNIFRVPTYEVFDEEQVNLCEETFVAAGYEGSMFRNANAPYEMGKRSKNLLKIKLFQDAEFEVIGFHSAEGGHTDCVIWECITPQGNELRILGNPGWKEQVFDVVPNGTLADRKTWFKNGHEYIGLELTVKFKDYSDIGKPLIAKGIAFRLQEDKDAK